ncbi:MAG: hypothetical protein QXK06_00990 [Candidatus Diapherotrites archaeon]
MLEKSHPLEKNQEMSEEIAKSLCLALECGGIILPDNCPAFQGKK